MFYLRELAASLSEWEDAETPSYLPPAAGLPAPASSGLSRAGPAPTRPATLGRTPQHPNLNDRTPVSIQGSAFVKVKTKKVQ